MSFLRRLDSAGMLLLAAEDEIPRDAVDRVPRNGSFAAYKDDDYDRSVCARVPRNRMERQIGLVRHLLPHASQFCDMQLDTSEDLVLDGDDIGTTITTGGLVSSGLCPTPLVGSSTSVSSRIHKHLRPRVRDERATVGHHPPNGSLV